MTVRHLLLKTGKGFPMEARDYLDLSVAEGIVGAAPTPPMRHILLLSSVDARRFRLNPGDFRENVVVDFDDLNPLPSGTELQIGTAAVRLTFHCEPCSRVTSFAKPSELLHRRGYLGSVSASGRIQLGDAVRDLGQPFPEIPYPVGERVAWYLERRAETISASELLWELGLPRSYARALPALLRKLPLAQREKVRFKSAPG